MCYFVGSIDVVDLADMTETFPVEKFAHIVMDGASLDSLLAHFPEMVASVVSRVTILCDVNSAQIDQFLDKWNRLGKTLGIT